MKTYDVVIVWVDGTESGFTITCDRHISDSQALAIARILFTHHQADYVEGVEKREI